MKKEEFEQVKYLIQLHNLLSIGKGSSEEADDIVDKLDEYYLLSKDAEFEGQLEEIEELLEN